MKRNSNSVKHLEYLNTIERGVALLIDPEKVQCISTLKKTADLASKCGIDFLFVGGSTVLREQLEQTISFLKKDCPLPIYIFPGSSQQIAHKADAMLFLSLISGRNPDYLIGHHVNAAYELYHSSLEIIPTGYVLIDGGSMSSVAYVSQTTPIPREQIHIARNTCMASILLGQKVLYLDAGSGAKQPIPEEMIEELSMLNVPLIVGGGIRSTDTLNNLHNAGANVCVIGNYIEENLNFLLDIALYKQKLNKVSIQHHQ
jgi:phosphoglycerol geranylgeranyltransferase